MKKKILGGGGGLGGGHGGCDLRIEVFGKIHTKKNFFGGGRGSGGIWRRGVRFGGGVRVDVNKELKIL